MAYYLHEAITKVLQDSGNVPMTIEAIADAIRQRGLYVKKIGSQVSPWNVGLRAVSDVSKSTAPLFEVLIRLRQQ